MVTRKFWLEKIISLWNQRSIIWLSGVRRVGKTVLCQSIPEIEYFDCELPSVRRQLEDPENFLIKMKGKSIILDEIHRLGNPSELLKIAADYYPDTKIVATGSSTLGASAKFKDTLAGRKKEIWLTPMISHDLNDFHQKDYHHRFLKGGLPPFFLNENSSESDYQEWIDAFWAKDIQELFRLERRYSFLRFTELIFSQSGGMFEATRFAAPCEVSRTTISNYLSVLEATYVVHIIRPYNTHRSSEIVSAPKVYAFDTGFICNFKGWIQIRQDDMGILWEHIVLNEMHGQLQTRNIYYWRDKRNHEIDFIIRQKSSAVDVIECKWSVDKFNDTNIQSFRKRYSTGKNYVVASNVKKSFTRTYKDLSINFVNLSDLIQNLKTH